MARHKKILDESELAVLEKETRPFKDTIELFIKHCELRNLRPPHTIQYYMNELRRFLIHYQHRE